MKHQQWEGGVLREQWDDTARMYTAWNSQGQQTTQRAYNGAENIRADWLLSEGQRESNAKVLRDRASDAIAGNNAFLALASPTQAQTLAQVKLLTRECSALARLALDLLDSTDT